MTYLDLLNELRKLPVYLLENDVELWRYSPTGDIEVMPVHHLVNPHDDDKGDPEWREGGSYYPSLQSFADEPEPPKKKFLVDVTAMVPFSFYMEAEDMDDAKKKASTAMWSEAFFNSIKDDIDFHSELVEGTMFDTMEWTQIQVDNDPDVDPIDVDSFI